VYQEEAEEKIGKRPSRIVTHDKPNEHRSAPFFIAPIRVLGFKVVIPKIREHSVRVAVGLQISEHCRSEIAGG
jgi:hypothetical protein